MITVEITIQKINKGGYGPMNPGPETILSIAFSRDNLENAVVDLKKHLDLLEGE